MAVEIQQRCPNCEAQMTVLFGERDSGEELTWYLSETCSSCGYATESDGYDQLPDNLRDVELQQNGIWSLFLISLGANPAVGLKAIKAVLGLSYTHVAQIRDSIPATVKTGTLSEIQFYQRRLLEQCDELRIEARPN